MPVVSDYGPFLNDVRFWISGQNTIHDAYRVYEFDNIAYDENDKDASYANMIWPWDNTTCFRDFGNDQTKDIFTKLSLTVFKYFVKES